MTVRSNEALQGVTTSALGGFAITKSDVTEFATMTKGLYVGTTGDVAVVMADGSAFTIPSVPAGAVLPIQVKQVKSTGTTADGFIGLY